MVRRTRNVWMIVGLIAAAALLLFFGHRIFAARMLSWDQAEVTRNPARWFVFDCKTPTETAWTPACFRVEAVDAPCVQRCDARGRCWLRCGPVLLPTEDAFYRVSACNFAGCSPPVEEQALTCVCTADAGGCPDWIWPAPASCP